MTSHATPNHGRSGCSSHHSSGTSGFSASMAPPKETPRERRLQQQRDALSHAVGMAQSSAAEAAVRVELLRTEVHHAEDSTSRANALVAGGAAERAALRTQLDALAAELRISRQANERMAAERISGVQPVVAGVRPSPAQARAAAAAESRNRLYPGRGGGRSGSRGRGGAPAAAPSSERRMIVSAANRLVEAVTQTADDDDDMVGSAVPRAAQAELAGLKVEVVRLREQVAAAASRRKNEIEGGERAHAAAMAAHGTSALHARLLWSEAHQLEQALAEAGATLARERRDSGAKTKRLEEEVMELRGTMAQQENGHQQQLNRARADRRVLHRNSRDFLDSKVRTEP